MITLEKIWMHTTFSKLHHDVVQLRHYFGSCYQRIMAHKFDIPAFHATLNQAEDCLLLAPFFKKLKFFSKTARYHFFCAPVSSTSITVSSFTGIVFSTSSLNRLSIIGFSNFCNFSTSVDVLREPYSEKNSFSSLTYRDNPNEKEKLALRINSCKREGLTAN